MTTYIPFLVALVAFGVGILIGKYWFTLLKNSEQAVQNERYQNLETQNNLAVTGLEQIKQENQQQLRLVEQEREQIRREKDFFKDELTRKNTEFENLQIKHREQKEEITNLQERFTKEFENLANRILDEKSTKFTVQNKENINTILAPLQEKIKHFEKRVEDTHLQSVAQHATLKQHIEGLQQLNQQMSKETLNLTKALKGDTKMQGNWGELVLERVLEKSNLEKNREYFVQQNLTNGEGKRVIPDVVIYLPDNKRMIIDSKVSLVAYERLINEEDKSIRAQHLKDHLFSLNKHVIQLSEKNYHELYEVQSPDFVLLFIPIEPAFAIALNEDSALYNKAFEKNIVIVTPTTLLATLRTIDSMWNSEKRQQNALAIAKQAGALYDQFKGLLDDFDKVGRQLQTVQNTYTNATKKLTGQRNLITKVEKLRALGAKTNKQIDQRWLDSTSEDEI